MHGLQHACVVLVCIVFWLFSSVWVKLEGSRTLPSLAHYSGFVLFMCCNDKGKQHCLWHRIYICVFVLLCFLLPHFHMIGLSWPLHMSTVLFSPNCYCSYSLWHNSLELCLKHHQVVTCGKGLLMACTLPPPLLKGGHRANTIYQCKLHMLSLVTLA